MANTVSQTTSNHDTIKNWTEKRGGKPAKVKGTGGNGDVGMLRLMFPGHGNVANLEEISWDDFFSEFDKKNLAFLYQEETATGESSRFFKFIAK